MQLLCAKASTTEEPDAEKPHVRVCAGGRWVTGVPTARGFRFYLAKHHGILVRRRKWKLKNIKFL